MNKIKALLVLVACALGSVHAFATPPEHHMVLPVVEVHSGAGSSVVARAIQDVKILGAGVTYAVAMSPAVSLQSYEVAGVDFQTGSSTATVITAGHTEGVAVASDLSLQDLQGTLKALTDAVPEGSKAELETTKNEGGI